MHGRAVRVGHGRPPLGEVDVDERLVRGDEQRVLGDLVGGEFEGNARRPDPRDPDVDLELVVEAGGGEVLDVVGPHDEVALGFPVQQPEQPVVLDAREVEVRVVPAVVDDPLRIGVGEPNPSPRAELERRLRHARGDPTQQGRTEPCPGVRYRGRRHSLVTRASATIASWAHGCARSIQPGVPRRSAAAAIAGRSSGIGRTACPSAASSMCVARKFEWAVYAWCLMPNHHHLVLSRDAGAVFGSVSSNSTEITRARTNRRHGRTDHLFRHRPRTVQHRERRTPRRRDRVRRPQSCGARRSSSTRRQWEWSSYRATVRHDAGSAWLLVDEALGLSGGTRSRAVAAFEDSSTSDISRCQNTEGDVRFTSTRPIDVRAHAWMSASTSSRFCSISSCERASRFRRRRGSVFDGRTLKCQSSASTEIPSRCEISASPA